MGQIIDLAIVRKNACEAHASQESGDCWEPPHFDDQLTFTNGIFVWAQNPDEFGPRVFQAVNIVWRDQVTTFLTDAATQWGLAPWALTEARSSMGLRELGRWEMLQVQHQEAIQAVLPAIRKVPDCDSLCTALFLVRCALRLGSLCKHEAFVPFVAERCVSIEFELDARIHDIKRSQHKVKYPDWYPPA